MAVSDAEIRAWLSANQGASDAQIRSVMQQNNVSPTQLANAIGGNVNEVQARYNAAAPASSAPAGNSVDDQIRSVVSGILSSNMADVQKAASIQATADRFGISRDQLARATGYDIGAVNTFLNQASLPAQQTSPGLTSAEFDRLRNDLNTSWSQKYEGLRGSMTQMQSMLDEMSQQKSRGGSNFGLINWTAPGGRNTPMVSTLNAVQRPEMPAFQQVSRSPGLINSQLTGGSQGQTATVPPPQMQPTQNPNYVSSVDLERMNRSQQGSVLDRFGIYNPYNMTQR